MIDINMDYNETVILESEDSIWITRDQQDLDRLVLTNKNLYCAYKKNNGLFKKPTNEICSLSLADIKIINGQAMLQQMKYTGYWCLEIQFRQGSEYFSFYSTPKKVIPQWVLAINRVLGTTGGRTTSSMTQQRNGLFSAVFGGAFSDVADSFKSIIDTASETLGIPTTFEGKGDWENAAEHHAPNSTSQSQNNESKSASKQGYFFCVNCGSQLVSGNKFCPNCGCKVAERAESVAQSHEKTDNDTRESPTTNATTETSVEATQQRQQEYIGKVYKCPNCSNVVNPSDTVCNACGFHLTGKKALSSALDFQQQILKIEMTRQNKKKGFWDNTSEGDLDATDKQIIALIKSYPIPNNIEDIVEFFYLAIGNINVEKSKKSVFNTDSWEGTNRERYISNAWVGKLQQIYKKAEFYFPNEAEFVRIKETYTDMMNGLKIKG